MLENAKKEEWLTLHLINGGAVSILFQIFIFLHSSYLFICKLVLSKNHSGKIMMDKSNTVNFLLIFSLNMKYLEK